METSANEAAMWFVHLIKKLMNEIVVSFHQWTKKFAKTVSVVAVVACLLDEEVEA